MKKSLQTLPVKHHRRQGDPGEFTIRRWIKTDRFQINKAESATTPS